MKLIYKENNNYHLLAEDDGAIIHNALKNNIYNIRHEVTVLKIANLLYLKGTGFYEIGIPKFKLNTSKIIKFFNINYQLNEIVENMTNSKAREGDIILLSLDCYTKNNYSFFSSNDIVFSDFNVSILKVFSNKELTNEDISNPLSNPELELQIRTY